MDSNYNTTHVFALSARLGRQSRSLTLWSSISGVFDDDFLPFIDTGSKLGGGDGGYVWILGGGRSVLSFSELASNDCKMLGMILVTCTKSGSSSYNKAKRLLFFLFSVPSCQMILYTTPPPPPPLSYLLLRFHSLSGTFQFIT